MKNKLMFIPVIAACVLFQATAAADSCQVPTGKIWKNDYQSEMVLNVAPSGGLSGTYKLAAGCGSEKAVLVKGFCNGYAVAFTLSWPKCGHLTSWSGTYNSNTGKLTTLWHLVLSKLPDWDSIVSGSDVFSMQ